MKIVSFYEMAPDALSKLKTHYPAHRARLDEFHARGVVLAAGLWAIRPKARWEFSPPGKVPKNSSRATPS